MNGQRVFRCCLLVLSIVHFSNCQSETTTSSTEDSTASSSTDAITVVGTTTVSVSDITSVATSTTPHLSTVAPVTTADPSSTTTGSPPSLSTMTPISFEPTTKPITSPVPDDLPESVLVDSDGLCPKDFVYFTKSAICYKVYSAPAIWVEADRICRKDKAVLVSAPLVQHPHFANLTTYWLNWRLRLTVQSPKEIKRNESEPGSRMWYRESIYPAKGNFITANEGLHAVHRASELQFARSILGTTLQPDHNVSEHGELGDSCLFATRSHPSSFEPYCPEILSTSRCTNPPNSSFSTKASFVCEFNVEEYAIFTAAQWERARSMIPLSYSAQSEGLQSVSYAHTRSMIPLSYSAQSEGLQSVSNAYKKKYKDCYTAFPFPNDTAYFHPVWGLEMSHWVVEGPERTTCYMTKYSDLESSKVWSFEGATEFCQQYSSSLQPSTAFPTLYQSRSVGQFVYSRFFDDVVGGVVATELGRWIGAVWVNGSEASGENGTWYWDGPAGQGVQVPLRFLLNIMGDDGKCLEERQQFPLELFTPEKISALLSGEGNSSLGWYRRSCSNQSSLGTLERSSVVCQKDLTRLPTTPPGDSVNWTVTIRKGYDNYSQWANRPDEIALLTCDIPENETLFDSPVVFLSSWFTYNSSVWKPNLTFHLNLDQVIGNFSGNQFSMDIQNGFRPEAPPIAEKNFCLADGAPTGPGQLIPPCVPSTETLYFGDIGLPSDYMLLRFAGYYQCGAVSSSTNQWVWSEPIYVNDSILRYPFQIRSSWDTIAASSQVAGAQNIHPFDNLWNFVLNAVENFTADFHTSNRSRELQHLSNGSSSIVLTVLQLEETNKLTEQEVTLSGLLTVRKMNMLTSLSGPQQNQRDVERQEPSYFSISPTEMARDTEELSPSEKFFVDRLMYSLDRHLVKSAKDNNFIASSEIIKSTSGCWNESRYFARSNLTFKWLVFMPDVVNRSFDYTVEYCPGTLYRRYCTGNREYGFTSKFVEGECTGPIVSPSHFTKNLLDVQADYPPGPEQLSALNEKVSKETNFSIVDLRIIGQILQSNTEPKFSPMPQSSFDNIYDVVNRVLEHDSPNNLGTAQGVYGTSNQFFSSMEKAAAAVNTTSDTPVDRTILSVAVFNVSSNSIVGFTANATGLSKPENGTQPHQDRFNVSMDFPQSLVEYLRNADNISGGIRGHFLVVRSTDFLNTQTVNFNSPSSPPLPAPSTSKYRLASWVVAASFFNTKDPIMNWKDNITIKIRVNETLGNSTSYQCVFWNPLANSSYGEWQTNGCHFGNYHQGYVVCLCNHLTGFAVLVDAHANQSLPAAVQKAVDVIQYIGLAFSFVGLICTIGLLFYAKLYINTHPRVFTKNQFVMLNLCFALLFGYIAFLAGIDAKVNGKSKEAAACIAGGAFIHYFFLVSFCWQAVEAYLLQTTFLSTLSDVHMHRFRSKTVLFCWGVPLVVVSVVLIVDRAAYFGDKICWIGATAGRGAFYGAFLAPVCLILLYSLIVFIFVIREISCTKKSYVRSTRSEEDLNTQLRRIVSLFFILGLPWLFLTLNAFGDTVVGRTAMHFLVAIFCGLQGVAIFTVTVLGMRKELFNRRKMKLTGANGRPRSNTPSVHTVSSTSTFGAESDFYRVGSEIAIIQPTSEQDLPMTVRYRRAGSFVSDVDSGIPSPMITFRHPHA